MSWGVACCPRCPPGTPLISTMVWAGHEFYCLDCGGRFTFFSPEARTGPAIDAKLAEYQKEWDENVGSRLLGNFWLESCDKCDVGGEYHIMHATEEEGKANDEALAWLKQRRKVSL